jgi:hypothetical protein
VAERSSVIDLEALAKAVAALDAIRAVEALPEKWRAEARDNPTSECDGLMAAADELDAILRPAP